MKKQIVLLLFVVLLTAGVFAADTSFVNIVLQSYDPYPAEPGTYITAKFKASNLGNAVASDFRVEFVPQYPFSLDSTTDALQSFGSLNPGDDVVFEYKIRVDEKAVIGDNTLTLKKTLDGIDWDDHDYNVLVKVSESVLSVAKITTTPEEFIPGETGTLDVSLENLAGTLLKDVSVKLNLETQSSSTTGTVFMDLPFAPVYSTTEKKLRYLEGGDTKIISFNLKTYADAESKLYKIPMTISYTDDSGNSFSKSDLVGVVVGSQPKLTTLIESSDIHSPGESGEILIKFINKGVTNIKFLSAKIKESNEISVLSTMKEAYIGNLDSDDYDSATFRIKVSKEVASRTSVTIPVLVEFMDANNKEYSEAINLELPFLSDSELGIQKKSPIGTIIFVILVVVVLGLIIWKRKKKNHHK